MTVNAFPASIQAIVQNGILVRTFQESMTPKLLYRQLATQRPFQANLGEIVIFTKTGLLAPVTTPLAAGTDPSTSNYSIEQYQMQLNSYGNAMDTNMLSSQIALASKFLEDNQKLAFNAGQTLNQLSRNKLYAAYGGGNTYATSAGSAVTTLPVNDTTGFATVLVNGQMVSVSATNTLAITINGTAAVVTAVSTTSGAGNLTLQSAATWSSGDPVVAGTAPKIIRPNARTTNQKLVAGDTAALSNFLDAVSYLRSQNVPDFGGYYVAHIDPVTERQLFADADFKQALQGRVDSPQWGGLSIGRFAGIDWVRNNEAPTVAGAGGVTVRRPILVGADALIEGPLQGFGQLLDETGLNRTGVVNMVDGVALIHRPPIDRLQQVISSAWQWVGDFGVPTDSLVGATSYFKRAVIVEHAG